MSVGKVKDFGYPESVGFTGSAGKVSVGPHMRGAAQPAPKAPKLPKNPGLAVKRPGGFKAGGKVQW